MCMTLWVVVRGNTSLFWDVALLMEFGHRHILFTKGRIFGAGGPSMDQLGLCIRSVAGWKRTQWFEKMFIPTVKHLTKDLPVVLFLMATTRTSAYP